MFKEVKMYTILCDLCGASAFEGEEIFAWGDKISAWQMAKNKDWVEVEGSHYCPDCGEEVVAAAESYTVCSATPKIKAWLSSLDLNAVWKQKDNPNCFMSNKLEALFVYEDCVVYYEDVRSNASACEHSIPESKSELDFIVH